MGLETRSLGQLELEVMKIVWDRQSCTVPQAAEVLAEQKGYARTTILTVMQRLHKKGFLKREKVDGVFRYYPTRPRQAVMGSLAKQFVNSIFGGSSLELVQHLAKGDVSADELAAIRKIIDEAITKEGEGK